jgi:hypothetical protein
MSVTKAQKWLRDYSKLLEISYSMSSEIEHKVTSGDIREYQVLDTLEILLPRNFPLVRSVVIIDSNDTESIKFDGAIVDVYNWPRLYAPGNLIVTPIESVKLVFEIKSNLGKTEMDKIYKEAENINSLSKTNLLSAPKVFGFNYKCANHKLAYYDFAESFLKTPRHTPSVICALNLGLFCFLNKHNNISFDVNEERTPAFVAAGDDSLLVFNYLLTEYLSEEKIASSIRKYSKHILNNLDFFSFEKSFLDKMVKDNSLRKHFEGNLSNSLEEVYKTIK